MIGECDFDVDFLSYGGNRRRMAMRTREASYAARPQRVNKFY